MESSEQFSQLERNAPISPCLCTVDGLFVCRVTIEYWLKRFHIILLLFPVCFLQLGCLFCPSSAPILRTSVDATHPWRFIITLVLYLHVFCSYLSFPGVWPFVVTRTLISGPL